MAELPRAAVERAIRAFVAKVIDLPVFSGANLG
jgi:hypothetical protein